MTEPFADEARLRAGWAVYQLMYGRAMAEAPLTEGTIDVPTLLLYGPDDTWSMRTSCRSARWLHRSHRSAGGPGAGHFLQWERADIFNPLLIATFANFR